MVEHIRSRSVFYLGFAIIVIIGLIALLNWPKGEAFLLFNQSHNTVLDIVFRYATWLGEWFGGVLVGLVLLFSRKLKYFTLYLIAITISSIASQGLKNYVFDHNKRPSTEYMDEIHLVDGIDLHSDFSFPSGHTTAAFCMFSMLAIGMEQRRWQFISIILAVLVGVSRMYLGQHYLIDVVAGSILGTTVATLVFVIVEPRLTAPRFNKIFISKK